jgi:UDP-glucose 4-epimerase
MKEGVLVTGASGFIGSRTNEALKGNPFEGDIRSVEDWEKNLKKDQIIFLIAGVRTETKKDFEINAVGTINLFDAINNNNKPKKIVLASSQAVYMGNQAPFKESQVPLPATVYGQSKFLAEMAALKWCRKFNIPLIILRYSAVLGPGIREKSKMSGPTFMWTRAALAGEPLKVNQDGRQSRDYVHIEDVVSANALAMNLPDGIYNVSGDREVMLSELAQWIKEAANSNSEIVIVGGEPTKDDPKRMASDTSKIRKYGWKWSKTAKEGATEFVLSMLASQT